MKKSGFVGLIGRPNVGKSTLLNSLLEMKLAIISSKPQTTRNSIRGIYNDEDSQIIFVDTPGIHKPKHELGNYMNKVSFSTLTDMDVILFLIDVNEEFGTGDKYILESIKKVDTPVILVVNKIDKIKDENLIKQLAYYSSLHNFSEIIPVSSLNGKNVEGLIKVIKSYLLPSIQYYDETTVTDISDAFYIKEIIREKVLYHTQEEIPHSVAVVVDEISDTNSEVEIFASIIVERKSQKGILIGKQGSMIKQLGSEARAEIKKYKNKKVHLELVVKVDAKWRQNIHALNKYGYQSE